MTYNIIIIIIIKNVNDVSCGHRKCVSLGENNYISRARVRLIFSLRVILYSLFPMSPSYRLIASRLIGVIHRKGS